jgi:hypothetical protein
MLNGRLGRAWFLECTSVSFREFFSLTKTGHTLALRGSRFGGIEMPREVKKEGGTSECSCPLLPPSVVSCCEVWGIDYWDSCLGEASLGTCLLRLWKDHPLVASSWSLFIIFAPWFPLPRLAKGLALASKASACGLANLGSPKHNLAFGVKSFFGRLSALAWVLFLAWFGDSGSFTMT